MVNTKTVHYVFEVNMYRYWFFRDAYLHTVIILICRFLDLSLNPLTMDIFVETQHCYNSRSRRVSSIVAWTTCARRHFFFSTSWTVFPTTRTPSLLLGRCPSLFCLWLIYIHMYHDYICVQVLFVVGCVNVWFYLKSVC